MATTENKLSKGIVSLPGSSPTYAPLRGLEECQKERDPFVPTIRWMRTCVFLFLKHAEEERSSVLS
jgi:hypothetical protein